MVLMALVTTLMTGPTMSPLGIWHPARAAARADQDAQLAAAALNG
jgi:hypothetical protein